MHSALKKHLRGNLKRAIVTLSAAAVACGDPGRALRPRAPRHSDRTVQLAGQSDTHRFVTDRARFSHYLNGQLFAVREGGQLTVYRKGREFHFTVPKGADSNSSRPAVSGRLSALLLPAPAFAHDGVSGEEDGGCTVETLALISTAGAVAVATEALIAGTTVSLGGLTVPALVALSAAVTAYGKAIDSYNKCVNKPTSSPSDEL